MYPENQFEFVFTLEMSLIRPWVSQLKTFLGIGRMSFTILLLKTLKFYDFLNFMVKNVPLDKNWGKKRIFAKNVFSFEKGYVQHFYWCKKNALKELILKHTEEIHFCKICNICKSNFLNHRRHWRDSRPSSS